jgi:hypothetical protein
MNVLLVEPQSRTLTVSSRQMISQCMDETVGCSIAKSLSRARPSRLLPGLNSIALDETGTPHRHAPDFFARRADGTGVLIACDPRAG